MEDSTTKTLRLQQLEHLLVAKPDGLTAREAAQRLRVHRSTAYRYIDELSHWSFVVETGNGRYAIDRDAYLNKIRLTMHEVLALHLASRLMAEQTDRHNPHAATAVRKLGEAVETFAPRMSEVIRADADLLDSEDTRVDWRFLEVLEGLTRAWSESRRIDLTYQSPSRDQPRTYRTEIYQIRPYAAGRTIHVIGRCAREKHLRTFRLDRIVSTTTTSESYEMPADIDLEDLLRNAWGVWYGESTTEVVLAFSPNVAPRVRESRWHPSEEISELPDGRLEWRCRVAEPLEMYPWIRGWGAEVEIVNPESLRERFREEVQRMAEMYGVDRGEDR